MSSQGTGPRPILKLKVNTAASNASAPSPSQTPATSTPKLKLKLPGSAPKAESPAGAEPSPKIKLKAPKKSKPKKISTAKKRGTGDDEQQEETPTSSGLKKIKLTQKPKTPSTPYIKIKGGNRPFHRPRGQAYDEIASDREDDPLIEEDFILRMLPGEDCDYVREACEKRSWGPRAKGGADVRLKFLTTDGRRAILTVRGRMYAATLVDMPCIIEGMKSWDRKSWYKSADIFQMLLVLGIIQNENEAMEYPLPPGDVDKMTMAYAHGLTPPMRWVRKRRFRKRISLKTIEAVEAEVERLLELDDEAVEPTVADFIDPNKLSRGTSGQETPRSDDEYEEVEVEVDADGNEVEMQDYFEDANGEEDEDALAAQFELAMQEGDGDIEAETPADSSTAAAETQNVTDSERATPAAGHTSKDEDSGDDDSGDDDDLEEMDEDAREQRADDQRQREEIADLEVAIKEQTAEMEKMSNAILKRKKAEKIQSLREELELKKAAIGEGEDD